MGTPPPQYNLPVATPTTLGGVRANPSRWGISVYDNGGMYRNGELNTNINTTFIYLSNSGDNSTATGSRTQPFKTIQAALNYFSLKPTYNNITFGVANENETYIITESICFNRINICFRTNTVANTAFLLHNIIYFYDCNLIFEGCKFLFDSTNYYMYLIGNTKITLGTYYGSSFTNNLTNGTVCNCFYTFGSDFNSSFKFSPFIVMSLLNFTLGANLRLLREPTYVNYGILMVKNCGGNSIDSSSFIYNDNVLDVAHRFNSTNIYIY